MRWEEIKSREQWLALPESDKRAISREILESAFGLPVNEHRTQTIEAILDSLYTPENIKLLRRTRVKLRQDLFNRWIITPADESARAFGWSGSRWVPIGGPVQVCNFDNETQAIGYATGAGFEVEE